MTSGSLSNLSEYEPLAPYTAWRIGGPARWFTVATTPAELVAAHAWAGERGIPLFVLGGGSNILVGDAGFPGLVARYRAAEQRLITYGDMVLLEIDAGAAMAGTSRKLAIKGYAGLEWAEGLPGTVGGAIYGNAGCYGGTMAGNLVEARLLLPDGAVESWPMARFDFQYRSSLLKRQAAANPGLRQPLILGATLRLHREDPALLASTIADIASSRKSKTPAGSSCGSVFKNPPGTTAGTLLDQAGLKGLTVGAAQVAPKHANYIVNLGGATAADVLRLTELMREAVSEQFGIELHLEVQLVGEQL